MTTTFRWATVVYGVLAFAAFLFLMRCFVEIGGNDAAVVTNFGAYSSTVLHPGLNFKWPWQSVLRVRTSAVVAQLQGDEAFSRDQQVERNDVTVNYSLDDAMLPQIAQRYRDDILEQLIKPRIQQWLKTIEPDYTAAQLIANRQQVTDRLRNELVKELGPQGVNITFVSVTDITPSKEYQDASEQRAIAQQELQRAQIELQTKGVQGQQNYVTAQYQAKANRELINSFGGDPRLADAIVRLKTIELLRDKWTSGNLPAVMGNGSALLDLSGGNGKSQ
ncbi:MAG: prohibitin family protein [Candidatus Eremiobacteraeota bacterium]|nr:prohibitin family protein [Candidatus Eremiobacteraeota bacterium]MBV8284284.1 prohibitin family protein [Candidatus Eremiobacteraeota bacterium]MBV8433819.1 prohibitin family protein [Candidatus Eremiobacteraeota bacterium]MBV8723696.1 prohibitin family protein [Candidatus Eremiobacteraeota bacterium]